MHLLWIWPIAVINGKDETVSHASPTPVASECFSRCTASSCKAKCVSTCQQQQPVCKLVFYRCQITPNGENLLQIQSSVEQEEKTLKLEGEQTGLAAITAEDSPNCSVLVCDILAFLVLPVCWGRCDGMYEVGRVCV